MKHLKILLLFIICAFFITEALSAQTITSIQYLDKNGILVRTPLKFEGQFYNSTTDIRKVTSSLRLYLSGADKKLTENPVGQFPGYEQDIDSTDSVAVWNDYTLSGDIVGSSYSFYVWAISPYVYGGPGQTTTYFRAEILINSLVAATIDFSSSSYSISSGKKYTVNGIDPSTTSGDTIKLKVSYRGGYGGTIIWGMGYGFESYIDIPSVVTHVSNDDNQFPNQFSLLQNYPNPFNPITTIEYQLPQDTYITLRVFNIAGQLVKTLIEEKQPVGSYKIQWNGRDEKGNSVAGGLYFYQLKADDFSQSNKMLLIR